MTVRLKLVKPVVPEMVRQLQAIKPGQEIVYYTGNFEADIASCAPQKDEEEGVPGYARMLELTRDAALTLQSEGKIRLMQRPKSVMGKNGRTTITEYVARGVKQNS